MEVGSTLSGRLALLGCSQVWGGSDDFLYPWLLSLPRPSLAMMQRNCQARSAPPANFKREVDALIAQGDIGPYCAEWLARREQGRRVTRVEKRCDGSIFEYVKADA